MPCCVVAMIVVWSLPVYADDSTDESPAQAFFGQVRLEFDRWDRDDDGELALAEVDHAVGDPATLGKAAAAISAIKRAMRSRRYQLPPLTLASLEQLATAEADAPGPDLPGMYADGLRRIREANRELFATGAPSLDTIHQGRLGNCYCLAPLGAVLSRSPDRVSQMFQLQNDGRYLVRLGTRQVVVAPPTDAELALTASNEQGGMWINLYEKALGEARNLDRAEEDRYGSPIDSMARGGSAGTMLAYLTGHMIQRFSCAFAKEADLPASEREQILESLRAYLRSAVELERPMTCGTTRASTPGISSNHAYAVLDFDADTDCLRLWDPHGGSFQPKGSPGLEHGYPQQDGVFSMPLEEFVEQFAGIAVETDLPVVDATELPKLPFRVAAEPQ